MYEEAPGFRPGPRKETSVYNVVDDMAGIICILVKLA